MRFRSCMPYASAFVLTALVAVLMIWQRPVLGNALPLIVFLIPVLATSLFGNVRAALLAVVIATLAGCYACFNPIGSFRVDESSEQIRLAAFLVIAGGIAFMTARLVETRYGLLATESKLRLTIDELHRAQERQQLIVREMRHRIRNMLANVECIASQTIQFCRSLPEFEAAFAERLRSLAEVNDLLAAANWADVRIEKLIKSEIHPRTQSSSQLLMRGPDVLLEAQTALSLHMVLHELCTNSVKYGALSTPSGRLSLCWEIELIPEVGTRTFRLCWKESGGPPVHPPKRRGFGSELLSKAIKYELGGRIEMHFAPTGLTCEISFPWRDSDSSPREPQGEEHIVQNEPVRQACTQSESAAPRQAVKYRLAHAY